MINKDEVVAIFCSDFHLSLKPPLARSGEADWFATMAGDLAELEGLADQHDAPIICAGDVFDRWNSPPELINFALLHLPDMYAVPGQHDLPLHNPDLIKKSAYWTLVEAGKIRDLGIVQMVGWRIRLWTTPWNESIIPVPYRNVEPDLIPEGNFLEVSLTHQYVWARGHSYPGAPKESRVQRLRKNLEGFDLAVFGDNHKGFLVRDNGVQIFNCGGFMRRKSDEIDNMPQVGILYESGKIEPYFLDISEDVITKTESILEIEEDMDLKEFLQQLGDLETTTLDFKEAVKQAFENNPPKPEVRRIILEAME